MAAANRFGLPPFYLLGDPDCSAIAPRRWSACQTGRRARGAGVTTAFADALPVVATGDVATARPGHPDGSSAPAAIGSIRQAVSDVSAGRASAMVTNPIAKSVLYRAGFAIPAIPNFSPSSPPWRSGAAAGDDVVVPCAGGRSGDDPSVAARRLAQLSQRSDRHHGSHCGRRFASRVSASRGRGSQSRASTRMPAKMARSATKRQTIIAPAIETPARRRHRCQGPAARRHAVSRCRAQDL